MLRRLSVITALALLAGNVLGQSPNEYKHEFMIWGGGSPDSTTIIEGSGRTPDVRFGMVSLRYTRRFKTSSAVHLGYVADATPLAVISYPTVAGPATTRETAYGIGGSPLGIKAIFRPRKKVQPSVEWTGGLLYFDKPVPGPLSKKFALTSGVGASVDVRLNNGRAISFGYKYFHISNGGRGTFNPGIDNNVFFVGYSIFSK